MLKKVLVLLVVAFVVYYLLTAPAGAADAVTGAVTAIMDAFGQIFVFFEELTR
ncbi:hypothetical protein [Aeromicrobium sp. CTD01-1L150]|uniref:hypothetical protein n=1 Tax=Aeromicrobium sp. CTD01-1L150 TaxID=3341830 RepID=UPI0035C21A6D